MKSKFVARSLAFVFLILVSTVASAGQETRLGSGSDPDIYGNKVVWSSNGSIHLYDITNGTDIRLNSSSASHPAVYEENVVWFNNSSGKPNLCVYNISTGDKFLITENVTGDSIYMSGSKPAIYGNIIVWQNPTDNENPKNRTYEVYMYDLSKFVQKQISNYGCHYGNPDIYEDRIVWANDIGMYGNGGSIWMYNVSTGNKTEILTGNLFDCAIYGDILASCGYGINYYLVGIDNIFTDDIIQINSSVSSDRFYPDVYGDRVLWVDERNCMSDIYMYDISTANETRISKSGVAKRDPVIYEDRIVWQDRRTNQSAVYMCDLSAEPIKPKASFTANVTSGESPFTVLFTDTSTGGTPENWYWDFGDGIHSKHAHTATHTFRKAGEYTVSLTVKNDAGSDTRTLKGFIRVS